MERLLRGSDSACRLHPDRDARSQIEIANRFDHHLSVRECRAPRCLPGARLDEVSRPDYLHRQKRSGPDVVIGVELAGLEDHLELSITARFDDGADLVLHGVELTSQKESAVDDHVDLISAIRDRGFYLFEAQCEGTLAGGECCRHGRHFDRRVRQPPSRVFYEERIDADSRDGWYIRIRARSASFLAERGDLPGGVLPLEGRRVDHRNRGLETPELRALLDAAGSELGHTLFDPDLIYGADLVKQLAEARAGGGSRWRGHDTPNIAPGIPHYNDEHLPLFPLPSSLFPREGDYFGSMA